MYKLLVSVTFENMLSTQVVSYDNVDQANLAYDKLFNKAGRNAIYYTVIKLY